TAAPTNICSRFHGRGSAPSAMASVTARCSAAQRPSSRSEGHARTAIPPSTEATVRQARCSSGSVVMSRVQRRDLRDRVSRGYGGPKAMKTRSRVGAAATATLLAGCAWLIAPRALAADMFVKAEEFVPTAAPWWYHYYVEVGARAFLNNPQRDGIAAFGGRSLAKYYEYSTLAPGPFLYGWASAGSKDGLYQIDAWATNVGYSDQQYGV